VSGVLRYRMAARLGLGIALGLALVATFVSAGVVSQAHASALAAASGPHEAGCPMFPANNPINREISRAPRDPNSASYIAAIGPGGHLHASFSNNVPYGMPFTIVGPKQPLVPVRFTLSASESDPGPYPVPLNAPVQGFGDEGDRHVLVLQRGTCRLYELYKAQRNGNIWEAGSGAVFNLRSNALRPNGWTSADAAGLPIFPLLARYPEVKAGAIKHALRVTVPRTQNGYVHPATHYSSSSSDPSLPPMGERLRLKASFSLARFHGEALIVLRALKRYGLIIADEGGAWNIGGTNDPGWSDQDLKQLETVAGSEFEAVSSGPIIHAGPVFHGGGGHGGGGRFGGHH
jgi:hypothetical protein